MYGVGWVGRAGSELGADWERTGSGCGKDADNQSHAITRILIINELWEFLRVRFSCWEGDGVIFFLYFCHTNLT